MLPSILLALREGIEIALVLSIVLGVLRKFDRTDLNLIVWLGSASAAVISIAAALMIHQLGTAFEGRAEAIFEGVTMLLAAGLLTWMIFWIQKQAGSIKDEIEAGVRRSLLQTNRWPLFAVAFLAVVREGIELAIFATASAMAYNPSSAILGTIIGLLGAVLLGYAIFKTAIQLELRRFFQVTGALLILVAAGLVAHGTHELIEGGLIPAIVENVYDLRPVLEDNSNAGLLLKTIFGYNANPSLAETAIYLLYLMGIFALLFKREILALITPKL